MPCSPQEEQTLFWLTADGNGHSPSHYFLEIFRTGEGQTAKTPLDVEAAFRGGTGVDSCSTLVYV